MKYVLVPITRPMALRTISHTQYGKISHGEWLQHEVNRREEFTVIGNVLYGKYPLDHHVARRYLESHGRQNVKYVDDETQGEADMRADLWNLFATYNLLVGKDVSIAELVDHVVEEIANFGQAAEER